MTTRQVTNLPFNNPKVNKQEQFPTEREIVMTPKFLIQNKKKWLLVFLCLILLFLTAKCAPRIKTAAWVIRYDIDSPSEIEQICTEAKTAKFDSLLVQVRGRADAYYQSAIAPRAESLNDAPPNFDPLAATTEACKPIPIHAWLNVYYLWGGDTLPEDPHHPALPHRNWILHDSNGRPVSEYSELDKAVGWIEGTYADPASKEYRQLFTNVVKELLEQYPVEGVHLDFLRYPGPAYGQTGELGKLYSKKTGIDPRWLPENIHEQDLNDWLLGYMKPADRVLTTAALFWADLRASQVTELLRNVKKIVANYEKQSSKLSVAIYPDAASAYLTKGQDWQGWLAEQLVDAIYPMAYFGEPIRVGSQLHHVAHEQKINTSVQLWAGLGAYIKEPDQIAEEANIARNNGYNGLVLFSLGHLLKKPDKTRPYTKAIAGHTWPLNKKRKPKRSYTETSCPQDSLAHGVESLKRIFSKAYEGELPPNEDLDQLIKTRLDEFTAALTVYFKKTLEQLNEQPVTVPEWIDLRGVFRYAHPLDSPARWDEQMKECEAALQRIIAGEKFSKVAREISQGGSRNLGGTLNKRYLDAESPEDKILGALKPGDTSPVIEVDNGFWCYLAKNKGPAEILPLEQVPWPARRIIFRKILAEIMTEAN